MFRSLAVRNYRVYATGAWISNVGNWMHATAQPWLVLELTGSGRMVGFAVALQMLPSLLFSPWAGALADRFERRKLLAVSHVAMAIPSAVLALLAITDVARVWHVFALTFTFGIARAFEAPVRQSYVAEMVPEEQLSNAVALNSASFNSARLVGPGIAGLLIGALGSGVVSTGWVLLLTATTHGATLLSLKLQDTKALRGIAKRSSGKGAIREGARYVWGRPDLMFLMTTVAALGAFGLNFQVTTALMATEEFGKEAGGFGLIGSVMAIGSVAGALIAARRITVRLRFVLVGAFAFSMLVFLSAFAPDYIWYLLVQPMIGLSLLTAVTAANSLIQMTTAAAMRGRVSSIYLMVFLGSVPLGAPIVGWIGDHAGARWSVAFCGIASAVGVLGAAAALAWKLKRSSGLRAPMEPLEHPHP